MYEQMKMNYVSYYAFDNLLLTHMIAYYLFHENFINYFIVTYSKGMLLLYLQMNYFTSWFYKQFGGGTFASST